jgi:hypothetical protein
MKLAGSAILGSAVLALTAVAAVCVSNPAFADHRVCHTNPITHIVTCRVEHDPPPPHGHGHSGDRHGGCVTSDRLTVPCDGPNGSSWNSAHQCYALPVSDPPPPLGDPRWGGHTTGGIFLCAQDPPIWFWDESASVTIAPPAAQLAQIAETKLRLPTMAARSNGGPSHTTYVGIPTWLWLSGGQWHTETSPPAAVAGESVTATAKPVSVSWSMGNGSSISCPGPGAPFNSADPSHPACGYTYRVDSSRQPQTGRSANDRYFVVRGTVTWQITWKCTGHACDESAGVLPDLQIRTTAMPLRVFQIETVVTGGH